MGSTSKGDFASTIARLGPLAELHRHLDGSLRPRTLVELAGRAGVDLPPDLSRLHFTPAMGLAGALERFGVTLSVLQAPEAVKRVAAEMCEDAEAEGISTLEIRFAPQLHRGAAVEAVVDAAREGIAGRAGLVLCGLYGEPPDVLEALVEVARSRRDVVGIDLAGGPTPEHGYHLEDYAPPFRRALELGLGRTVHAGEGRPAAEIRIAIEVLHATRIGHGTTLLDDDAVTELALARGVTVEACPTSNVHTGVIASVAAHPIARWLARGVSVTVAADNTFFSQTTATEELRQVSELAGVDDAMLAHVVACGHRAAFRRD